MEVIAFVFVVGCFLLFMWHRGAFSPDSQPAAIDPHAWPLDHYRKPEPEMPGDYCPERDGWPADDSPRWRLGQRGRPGTGGHGMLIVVAGDGGCGGDGGGC